MEIKMTPFLILVIAYWFVGMGFFIVVKGKGGDEIPTFFALSMAVVWPLVFILVTITMIVANFLDEDI